MATKEAPNFNEQPMLDGFTPVKGIDIPVNPVGQVETSAAMAEIGARRAPLEPRQSEAFTDLGGGTSETASTELPKSDTLKSKRHSIGHVRDIEPRDSDLDPEWTSPSPKLTEADKETIKRNVPVARAMLRRATRPAFYDYLQQFPVSQQLQILRAREERRRHIE